MFPGLSAIMLSTEAILLTCTDSILHLGCSNRSQMHIRGWWPTAGCFNQINMHKFVYESSFIRFLADSKQTKLLLTSAEELSVDSRRLQKRWRPTTEQLEAWYDEITVDSRSQIQTQEDRGRWRQMVCWWHVVHVELIKSGEKILRKKTRKL